MPKFTTAITTAPLGATPKKRSRLAPKAPATTGEFVSRSARNWSIYNDELRDQLTKVLTLLIDTATIGQWKAHPCRAGQRSRVTSAD